MIKVLRWSVDNLEFNLDQCPMVLDRILYPFLKWHQHPAVLVNDTSAGATIQAATTRLLLQFELYAVVIAQCDSVDEIPGEDAEQQFDDPLRELWEKISTGAAPHLASLVQSGEALPKPKPETLEEPAACLIRVRKLLTENPYRLLQNAVNDWAEAPEVWRWL